MEFLNITIECEHGKNPGTGRNHKLETVRNVLHRTLGWNSDSILSEIAATCIDPDTYVYSRNYSLLKVKGYSVPLITSGYMVL